MSLSNDWRLQIADAVTDPVELCQILQLPLSNVAKESAKQYPLLVTQSFLRQIEPGNLADPLLLQILPQNAELETVSGFSRDPLGEIGDAQSTPHCLQKYVGRMLVLTTDFCAVHCRFCFRRHFPKQNEAFSWEKLKTVKFPEVILSGGDPLMLENAEVKKLFYYMEESTHVNRVRLHTRTPIMIPERVDNELIAIFQKFRRSRYSRSVFLVLHVNHARELSGKVKQAIAQLIDAGIPVLSQTVLLKNVNDHFEALFELFETLADHRVLPYYLHQLDRIAGAAHFEVPVEEGLKLMKKLKASLPGYAVPRYVQEIAEMPGKVHL